MVPINLSELYRQHHAAAQLRSWLGEDRVIEFFQSLQEATPGGLVFAASTAQVEQTAITKPSVVVTNEQLSTAIDLQCSSVLIADNVSLAHAILRQHYYDRDVRDPCEWGRIHPSAVIHGSTFVPEDVLIGPNSVIGQGVQIGRRCVVMAGAIVESGAILGDDCILHPHVVLGYDCVLGKRVIIKSGTIIGAEGYGFAEDDQGRNHRIPQTGKVVLGDDVVIGANCTIDRATYAQTHIGNGCKLDAHCHIGHNVSLGEDCVLVAQSGIAGSCVIGDRVRCSGQTGILDHKQIVSDTLLVMRCGVTEDISEPGIYAGTPAQPFKEYKRNVAAGRRLAKMRQELRALQRRINKFLPEDST
ncbi:MAG TPA: UDP-3-O-(3-hydroxymyristoyl)glucosamine N-acyltransferase [Gammaproteobacteria bacterium]|nr:UDP-3-O-(3-hydroxymyristoyl)glucosamine N-acyltransferase [Gammaproteobacteria bacterium]